MAVAAKYMKPAGYPSGKYTGGKTLQIVGSPARPTATTLRSSTRRCKNLGFKTKFKLVDSSVMYAKFCGVPKEESTSARTSAGSRDFADPQTVLDIAFNGKRHRPRRTTPTGGQLNDPHDQRRDDESRADRRRRRRARTRGRTIDRRTGRPAAAIPWRGTSSRTSVRRMCAGVRDLWNLGHWDFAARR